MSSSFRVQSFGIPRRADDLLPPGYTCVRRFPSFTQKGEQTEYTCRITSNGTSPVLTYLIEAADCSSTVISETHIDLVYDLLRQKVVGVQPETMLKSLEISTLGAWNGKRFFGLSDEKVISQIAEHYESLPSELKVVDPTFVPPSANPPPAKKSRSCRPSNQQRMAALRREIGNQVESIVNIGLGVLVKRYGSSQPVRVSQIIPPARATSAK
eukprot:ANDGO_03565.mRNA.1 hypothetical protein